MLPDTDIYEERGGISNRRIGNREAELKKDVMTIQGHPHLRTG